MKCGALNFVFFFFPIPVDRFIHHCRRRRHSKLLPSLWELYRRNILDSAHRTYGRRIDDFRHLVPRLLRGVERIQLDDFDVLRFSVDCICRGDWRWDRRVHQARRIAGHFRATVQQDTRRLCKFCWGATRVVAGSGWVGMLRHQGTTGLASDLQKQNGARHVLPSTAIFCQILHDWLRFANRLPTKAAAVLGQ